MKFSIFLFVAIGVFGQTIISTGNDIPNHKSPVTFELDFSYAKGMQSRLGRGFRDVMDFFVDDFQIKSMTVNRVDKKKKVIFDFQFSAHVRESHDKLINVTVKVGDLPGASLPYPKAIEERKLGTFKIRLELDREAFDALEDPKLAITLNVRDD